MKTEISSKDDKWLSVAGFIGSTFSTCSRKQYCALIIASNGRVVGLGYNGSAPSTPHCYEGGCPRAMSDSMPGSVYDNCTAIHAEANAIMWSDVSLRSGATLYVNGPPCFSCAKLIASSGISGVVCVYNEEYQEFDKVLNYLKSSNIVVRVKY